MLKFPSEKNRRFQASWFKLFPAWLEYSPTKDAAFYLPCYHFHKPNGCPSYNAFTLEKKVNDGKNCAFLSHVGKDHNSLHKVAMKSLHDLANQEQHIEKIIERQSCQQIENNRLHLKASIDAVQWLTFQACSLRGHDESSKLKNRGKFIELVKLLASYNEDVDVVVLKNAPQNSSYTSPKIQKEILLIISSKVQKAIHDEIGDAKFCIMVDESRDESKREQMYIVLRFVDRDGYIKERFFDLVHVFDTTSLTLKNEISIVLAQHNLNIQNVHGQRYDGASNMHGEWLGLQALFLNECPYAYYIHCFAHRLQLSLIGASREVISIHQFLSKLTFIVNVVTSSSKRHDQLQVAHATLIEQLIANNELETGRELNQVGTVKISGDTRWSSHLSSVRSLIVMFEATCSVLKTIISEGATYAQRGDADSAYNSITSFEFVFILHLMKEILEVTDDLCQALQRKSQDILNAMHLVSTTKALIQKMRESGYDILLQDVKLFCEKHEIDFPNMGAA